MHHSPAGLQCAAWGWTCKNSGHCSTDFKNQSGIRKWYMDWFPKLSHHAVAQIEVIASWNNYWGNLCFSQSQTRLPKWPLQTSKSIKGEFWRIWEALIMDSMCFISILHPSSPCWKDESGNFSVSRKPRTFPVFTVDRRGIWRAVGLCGISAVLTALFPL